MPKTWCALTLFLVACASGAATAGRALPAPEPNTSAASGGAMADRMEVSMEEEAADDAFGALAPPPSPRAAPPQLAQAVTASAEPQPGPAVPTDGDAREVSDALSPATPLIVYTATLTLAVFEVQQSVDRVREVAQRHGGYVSRQTDTEIQVRVPAGHFDTALAELEGVGDVLSRHLEARDVSEEFHDLSVRIRTAEKLLARLERLLERAENVEHALQVEREIRRLTQELEGMKGRQRFLAHQASFSTLTLRFRPVQREEIDQSELFDLPFPWLQRLGLDTLLELQ